VTFVELTFAQQSTAFLYSILLGIAFGIAYAPFKIFRLAFCLKKVSIFITDFIYMMLVSVVVFYFSIAFLLGYVRFYVYIGCVLGFLLYRLTLGRLFSKIYSPIILFCKKISQNTMIKIKNFAKKLLKIACNILYNIRSKTRTSRIFKNKNSNVNDKRAIEENEK
jgi:hypothetical protein